MWHEQQIVTLQETLCCGGVFLLGYFCTNVSCSSFHCSRSGQRASLCTHSCRWPRLQQRWCHLQTEDWELPSVALVRSDHQQLEMTSLTTLVVPQGSRPKPLTVMLWCSHVAARISLKVAENATHPALQWVNRALLQKNPVGFGEPPRHDGSKAVIDAVLWSPVLVSLCRNSNLPLFAV